MAVQPSQALANVDFASADFSESGTITQILVSNPAVEQRVRKLQQMNYPSVNVATIFQRLERVGVLLQAAFAGSRSQRCCPAITGVLCDYKKLIINSSTATSSFVKASRKALQYHAVAIAETLEAADDNLFEPLEYIQQCAKFAQKMETASYELASSALDLGSQSKNALQDALNNQVMKIEDKEALEQRISEFDAKQEGLKNASEQIAKDLKEARKREKVAAKKADSARTTELVLNMVSSTAVALLSPVAAIGGAIGNAVGLSRSSNASNEEENNAIRKAADEAQERREAKRTELTDKRKQLGQAEIRLSHAKQSEGGGEEVLTLEQEIVGLKIETEELEKAIEDEGKLFEKTHATLRQHVGDHQKMQEMAAQERANYQTRRLEINADLAETVSRLKSMNESGQDLEKAIIALEVAIKALGQAYTTFMNTGHFWRLVSSHCEDLAEIDMLDRHAKKGAKERLLKALRSSAFNWLALADINLQAQQNMTTVNEQIDTFFRKLPSEGDAKEWIEEKATLLLQQLNAEVEAPARLTG